MSRDPLNRNIYKSPGGMLYFKIGVPAELRRHFPSETGRPRTKITESLGTDSWKQARVLRDQRVAHWGRVFARLAAGAVLTPEEIAGEQRRIHASTVLAMLAAPPETPLPEELQMFEAIRSGIRARAEVDRPAILADVRAEARRIADEKLGAGIIAEGTSQWDDICRLVASTKAKALEDHLFGLLRGSAPVEQPLPAPVQSTNGNERFSVAAEKYLAWLGNEQDKRPGTVEEYRAKIERFEKFANDPLLGAVTIDMAKAFLDDVRDFSIVENEDGSHRRVRRAEAPKPQTMNMYHHACRAVFEHARTERHLFSEHWLNPFSFKPRKRAQQSKAKFTVDELQELFGSPTFVNRQTKPKKYNSASAVPWAAAIALYSGTTLEEIAQLRPQDIRKERGDGWIIDITPDAALSHRLKREARRRIVPLHPELVRLGLLKYLDALPRNVERVFPGLPIGGKGKDKFGDSVGKAFRRWRDKVGIVSTPDHKLDFHSFRHTFYKAMEDAGIPGNDVARLSGHEVKGMAKVYSGPELSRVAPLVAKVGWPGLRIK
jgi:integrase